MKGTESYNIELIELKLKLEVNLILNLIKERNLGIERLYRKPQRADESNQIETKEGKDPKL